MEQEQPNSSVSPLTDSSPTIPPVDKKEVPSSSNKIIAEMFTNPFSSFLVIVLATLIVYCFIGSISVLFTPLGIVLLLSIVGDEKESLNATKAIGTIILIIIGLAVIGFGVCLLGIHT